MKNEFEDLNRRVNEAINTQVERKIKAFLEKEKGTDWTQKFEDVCRQNVELMNLLARCEEKLEKAMAHAVEWGKERDELKKKIEMIG